MEPIIDKRLIWYAYYKNEPIAFMIMVPEINQIVRHLNGSLNLWHKIQFLYYIWKNECTKILGIIFGIVPEHQGKGLEGALVMAFANVALKPGFRYKEIEMNWIGDFNPSMIKVIKKVGAKIRKVHVTYRYLFDRAVEFKRAEVVNVIEKEPRTKIIEPRAKNQEPRLK
jgi:GNAT superfamily N-acetyltransferase